MDGTKGRRGETRLSSSDEVADFSVGDLVVLERSTQIAEITDGPNKRGQLQITLGTMKMWVAPSALRVPPKPRKGSTRKPLPNSSQGAGGGVLSIDLHGKTTSEVEDLLIAAIDRALRSGTPQIEIIHGLGTGAVRNTVYAYCESSRHVSAIREVAGNPGCSIIYL